MTQVVVNGETYLASGSDLTVDAVNGTWSLTIPAGNELTDATYEVAVTAEDALGNATTDTTSNELVIDTTASVTPQNLVLDGSEVLSGVEATALLGNGASVLLANIVTGNQVVTRTGEALTSLGTDLTYRVDSDTKITAVTSDSNGTEVFTLTATVTNGVASYSLDLIQPIDPVVISSTLTNGAFSPSNEASKSVTFGDSFTVTASGFSQSGVASTVNGNNAGFGVGGGGEQQGVDGSEILRFDVSDGGVPKSILGFTLSLVQLDEAQGKKEGTPVDGVWIAYSYNAETGSYDEVATGELTSGVNTIAPGVSFDRIELSTGEGGPFAVSDSLSDFAFEVPVTIDLQATVDGSAVDFSITFDQLSASDTTMEAVDPDSLLLAGAGSETLIGLAGEADTFEWNLADGTAEGDTIQGFEEGSDVIDLSDLLTGYDPADPNNDDLADFIQVTYDSATGDTTIEVSSNGDGTIDQVIKVEGVDLTDDVSLTGLSGNDSINAILSDMMTKGTLIDPDI